MAFSGHARPAPPHPAPPCRVFPRGGGLLNAMSDWMLARALRGAGAGAGSGGKAKALMDFNAPMPPKSSSKQSGSGSRSGPSAVHGAWGWAERSRLLRLGCPPDLLAQSTALLRLPTLSGSGSPCK